MDTAPALPLSLWERAGDEGCMNRFISLAQTIAGSRREVNLAFGAHWVGSAFYCPSAPSADAGSSRETRFARPLTFRLIAPYIVVAFHGAYNRTARRAGGDRDPMPATIKEVAKRAKVAIGTVSRVINN